MLDPAHTNALPSHASKHSNEREHMYVTHTLPTSDHRPHSSTPYNTQPDADPSRVPYMLLFERSVDRRPELLLPLGRASLRGGLHLQYDDREDDDVL